AHGVLHGPGDARAERRFVHVTPRVAVQHHLPEVFVPRQVAGMACQDAVRASLHVSPALLNPDRRWFVAFADRCYSLCPQALSGDAGALHQRVQLGPGDLGVPYPGAEAAVCARDDVLPADDGGVALDAVGDELRRLDEVRVVADDAGDEDDAVRELRVLPGLPVVRVAGVRGFDGEALGPGHEHDVDDVAHLHVVLVGAV